MISYTRVQRFENRITVVVHPAATLSIGPAICTYHMIRNGFQTATGYEAVVHHNACPRRTRVRLWQPTRLILQKITWRCGKLSFWSNRLFIKYCWNYMCRRKFRLDFSFLCSGTFLNLTLPFKYTSKVTNNRCWIGIRLLIANALRFRTSKKKSACWERSSRKLLLRTFNCFKRLLTISCLARIIESAIWFRCSGPGGCMHCVSA